MATDAVERWESLGERKREKQLDVSRTERRLERIVAKKRQQKEDESITEAARRRNAGEPIAKVTDFQEMEETARRELRIEREALRLVEEERAAAKRDRDEQLIGETAPAIEEAAQAFAEKLVAVGDAADRLYELLDDLDARSVTRLHRFPGLRLFPLRSSEPTSRLNGLLGELEKGYGVSVDRSRMEATAAARRKAHLALERRKQMVGGVVAAGPDGVTEYAPGGKVRRRT